MLKTFICLLFLGIAVLSFADVTNLSNKKISEQLSELSFDTNNLDKPEKAFVVVPSDYYRSNALFPVVYLLHGWSGDYKAWYDQDSKGLEKLSDLYDVIIVMPDGGFAGWYVNSPFKKKSNYESAIAEDLVEAVDQSFNTFKMPTKRAITGLSMGGFGAFYLAFKHPDTFGAAGAMSGGLELVEAGEADPVAGRHFDIDSVLSSDSPKWKDYDVDKLLDKVKISKQPIIFDCGVNDIFIKINRNFHAKMLEMQIPHDYTERPGIHDWNYWDNSIDYQMIFFSKYFLLANISNSP
ncbi:MAG: alpha/beta hydrolase family protein [Lentisphaerota bacterium]